MHILLKKKKKMISGGYLEDLVSSAQPPVISYWLRVFLVAACRVRNLPNPFSGKKMIASNPSFKHQFHVKIKVVNLNVFG